MKSHGKRLCAYFLIFTVMFSSVSSYGSLVVRAEGGIGAGKDDIKTNEDVRTETTDNEFGGTTSTTITEKEWSGTDEDNAQVAGSELKKDTTVTNGDGDTVSISGTSEGRETTTKTDSKTESSSAEESDSKVETSNPENISHQEDETVISDSSDETAEDVSGADVDAGSGNVTISLKPGETKTEKYDTDESKIAEKVLGTLPAEGIDEKENADGSKTITEVTYAKDDAGNVIGYTTTTSVITRKADSVTEKSDPVNVSEDSKTGETSTDVQHEIEIILPTKPAEGETVHKDGTTSRVTVTELLDEEGTIVGYQTTTVVFDKKGKQISSSTESVWGVRKITTTTKVTPTTTTTVSEKTITRTDTEVITTAVTKEGVQITATDREVTASMENIVSKNVIQDHANLDVTQPLPDENEVELESDLFHRPDVGSCDYDPDGTAYQWLGKYGLESLIRVLAGSGEYSDTYQAHQFILTGPNDTEYYVYCSDFEVGPKEGIDYNMERLEDAAYFDDEVAEHIRAIVMNGYWGTSSGMGSMEQFRSLLAQAGFSEEELKEITPGMAVTATQAAIWYYGNSGAEEVSSEDIVGRYYNGPGASPAWSAVDGKKEELVNRIYQYLIQMAGQEATAQNTLITKESFAQQVVLTVKDKIDDEKYKTDLSFSLVVLPNDEDNLRVYVLDSNDNVIAEQVLKKENGKADGNGNYIYTFADLQLTENENITLKISGTQNLSEGVYLFTACDGYESSQTFVGTGTCTQDIDLSVRLKFSVTDATAQKVTNSSEKTTEKTTTDVFQSTETTTLTKVVSNKEVITDTTDQFLREWASGYEVSYLDEEDENGGENQNHSGFGVKTGDEMPIYFWGILLLASIGGLVAVIVVRRRKKTN